MTRPIVFQNLRDLINRYEAGESVNQLAKETGCSRAAIGRAMREAGVELRGRSEAERVKWAAIKGVPDAVSRQLGAAWAAADARNAELERKVLSLYRSGPTSQAEIARRLRVAKPTVGGILRRNGIERSLIPVRRARGKAGGFCTQNLCAVETVLADELTKRGLAYIHQHAICTRNVDFGFAQERVAVEIVRRHWNDAKSLCRQRLEELFGAGWRLLVIYDPGQGGVDVASCAKQIVSLLECVRGDPTISGQYGMIRGTGEVSAAGRPDLHHFARIPGF